MPTPQEEQVNANLDLLLTMELFNARQDPGAQQALKAGVDRIRRDYEEAVAKGAKSKKYKDVGDAIAKSLPSLVKGASSAAEAFKRGDYIGGSAALMDICASIIPIISAVLGATGPEGALFGALFSVIGQILSLFGPKQPSLKDEIQKMLDHLQGEAHIEALMAFGFSVSSYTASLREKSLGAHRMGDPVALTGSVSVTPGSTQVVGSGTSFRSGCEAGAWLSFDADPSGLVYKIDTIASDTRLSLSTPFTGDRSRTGAAHQRTRTVIRRSLTEILAMPLGDEGQADAFLKQMKELEWGLAANQEKLNTPIFEDWKVAAYLQQTENQRKEDWPHILGLWCRTYIDLITANTMLIGLADPATLERRLAETRETATDSPLPTGTRARCHSAILNLHALVDALGAAWASDYAQTLDLAQRLRPVAKERGLYAHLGEWQGGRILYVARGDGGRNRLQWDYKKDTTWLRRLSIYTPRDQQGSFTPVYGVLVADDRAGNRIWYHRLDAVTGNLTGGELVIEGRYNGGERFLDVQGLAFHDPTVGIDGRTNPRTLVALAIEENGPGRYLNYYTLDEKHHATRVNYEPRMAGLADARSQYLPAQPLPTDPDRAALTDRNAAPSGPALLAGTSAILYGGVRGRNIVHVTASNTTGAVQGPERWSGYNGIEVDPYYIWLFGKGGIACATHASMIKCRQGKISAPNWIYHDFPSQFHAPEVTSLFPAEDGTLLVAMSGDIYTADYEIDFGKRRVLTSQWFSRGGQASQVVKMTIPCWPILDSLITNLQQHGAGFRAMQAGHNITA